MKQHRLALITICLGFFVVIMDATIVNAALPAIATALHSNLSDLQWVVAGYTLSFVCLLMLAGSLVDRIGGRSSMAAGLIGFLITSLACALAPSNNWLIVFRILQGLSATPLIPASLRLISDTFADKKERAHAIGVWGGIGGIAAVCGPLVCSLLVSYFSWRSIFLINVPICIIALIMLYQSVINKKPEPNLKRFDFSGLIYLILFAFGVSFAIIEGGRIGWEAHLVIGSFILAGLALVAFVLAEQRAQHPIIPLPFFRTPSFSIAITTGFIINCSSYGLLFMLPLYLNHVKHYATADIGFAMLPLLVLTAIASFLSGKAISRWGTKKAIIAGLFICALSFLGLLCTTTATTPYLHLVLPLAAIGFGSAFAVPAVAYAAIHSVPESRSGMASGAFTTARQMGSLIGVAVFGTIAAVSPSFLAGFHVSLIISAGLALLGTILNFSIKGK
jgi:DHA2 family methylenomycin A resistance protein-like MFS transporter